MWPKTTTYLRIWPNYGWPNRCAKSPIHWSIGSPRKTRPRGAPKVLEKAVAHGASKSNVARAAGASPANAARRFPRLGDDAASQTRLLIDDVLDTLE